MSYLSNFQVCQLGQICQICLISKICQICQISKICQICQISKICHIRKICQICQICQLVKFDISVKMVKSVNGHTFKIMITHLFPLNPRVRVGEVFIVYIKNKNNPTKQFFHFVSYLLFQKKWNILLSVTKLSHMNIQLLAGGS